MVFKLSALLKISLGGFEKRLKATKEVQSSGNLFENFKKKLGKALLLWQSLHNRLSYRFQY